MHAIRILVLMKALVLACVFVAAVAPPTAAWAKGGPGAKEFQKGRKLFKKGQFDEALALFQQAFRESNSPNARLYVARTLRELGRTTEAYQEMRATLDEARTRAASEPKYVKTRDSAAAELALLEPGVAKLLVTVSGADAGVEVTIDGRAVAVGKPIVLEPGPKTVVATAPGKAEQSQQIDVQGGETSTVTLSFTPAGGAPAPADTTAEPGPDAGPTTATGGGVQVAGFVVAGLGAASMVAFAITAVMAKGEYDTLDEDCGGVRCTDMSYADTVDSGETLELVSHVTLGVGVAGLVAGGLMIIFGGPSEESASSAGVAPLPGGALLSWGGRF